MLRVDTISLLQFKNYSSAAFAFSENVVGICGANGTGKTNLLDAIHYLCFTKSYFNRSDQLHVQHGSSGFRVEGTVRLDNQSEKAVCILRDGGKKEFLLDGQPYNKFSEHIGRYPCVVIAPDDVQLIIGTSDVRRSFLDSILSQLDRNYLRHLITYTKVLQHRNSFLKNFRDSYSRDLSVLDALDEQLCTAGQFIFETRKTFLHNFLPVVQERYASISQKAEPVHLLYDSELHHADFAELLRASRQKDLVVQRTSAGIHRDDLEMALGEVPFKSTASQGQRKSLLFALKLSEVDVIVRQKGLYPLLLLDDIFEKLDEQRIENLLQTVAANDQMQIFITDTSCARLKTQLGKLQRPIQIIEPGNRQ